MGRNAFFKKALFRGPVNFVGATIGSNFFANGTQFEKEANFRSLRAVHNVYFNELDGAKVVFRGPVSFVSSSADDLHFEGTGFNDVIKFDGMTYKRIVTKPQHVEQALKMLRQMERYYPQPYKQLELYYTEVGDKGSADKVFLEGKKRDTLDTPKRSPWDYLTIGSKIFFLEWLVGYGRDVKWLIIFIIGFIGFGTLVFSQPGMFKNVKKLSFGTAFWYSFGLFVPFVNLGTGEFYRIEKGEYFCLPLANALPSPFIKKLQFRIENYYYLHQVFGYICVSIAITTFAGIIK